MNKSVCFLKLLVSAILLIGMASCDKPTYPVVLPLTLLAPATITPSSSFLMLGDTLWVETSFSDSLLDFSSGLRYQIRLRDMILNTYFSIEALHGAGKIPTGSATTFRLVERIGKAAIGGTFTGQFFPSYNGRFYRTKFGLIPTQRGVITISLLMSPPGGAQDLGSIIPFIHLPPDAQGKEQKPVLKGLYFVINEGKTNNYDLFCQQYTTNPEVSGQSPEQLIYVQKSTFTVEVK